MLLVTQPAHRSTLVSQTRRLPGLLTSPLSLAPLPQPLQPEPQFALCLVFYAARWSVFAYATR